MQSFFLVYVAEQAVLSFTWKEPPNTSLVESRPIGHLYVMLHKLSSCHRHLLLNYIISLIFMIRNENKVN